MAFVSATIYFDDLRSQGVGSLKRALAARTPGQSVIAAGACQAVSGRGRRVRTRRCDVCRCHFYEVIPSETPVALHFDLDASTYTSDLCRTHGSGASGRSRRHAACSERRRLGRGRPSRGRGRGGRKADTSPTVVFPNNRRTLFSTPSCPARGEPCSGGRVHLHQQPSSAHGGEQQTRV